MYFDVSDSLTLPSYRMYSLRTRREILKMQFSSGSQDKHLSSISICLHLSLSISIYLHRSPSISIYLHLSPSITIYLHLSPSSSISLSIYHYLSPSISMCLHMARRLRRRPDAYLSCSAQVFRGGSRGVAGGRYRVIS